MESEKIKISDISKLSMPQRNGGVSANLELQESSGYSFNYNFLDIVVLCVNVQFFAIFKLSATPRALIFLFRHNFTKK